MRLPDYCGIYMIICKKTNDTYVGSSYNIRTRAGQHINDLRKGSHANDRMQSLFDTYGESKFRAIVLQRVFRRSHVRRVEQKWIDRLKPSLNMKAASAKTKQTYLSQSLEILLMVLRIWKRVLIDIITKRY